MVQSLRSEQDTTRIITIVVAIAVIVYSIPEAIAAWNRRSPALAALVEEAERPYCNEVTVTNVAWHIGKAVDEFLDKIQ